MADHRRQQPGGRARHRLRFPAPADREQCLRRAGPGGRRDLHATGQRFSAALERSLRRSQTGVPPANPGATLSITAVPIGAAGVAAVTATANNDSGGYTVTAAANGATPTSVAFNLINDGPIPVIAGLPTSSPEGTAITVTASATDPIATETAAGFSYLWQATDSQGISSIGSQALSFNGTNQFVDLGNPTDLNISGQITLEAWIKPESTTGLQDIIAHGYQVSPNYAEDFLRINNGYYQAGSWNGNTAMAQAAIPASDVGQWVFLAGVYDGTQW